MQFLFVRINSIIIITCVLLKMERQTNKRLPTQFAAPNWAVNTSAYEATTVRSMLSHLNLLKHNKIPTEDVNFLLANYKRFIPLLQTKKG